MPRRQRAPASWLVTSVPSKRTMPAVGGNVPARTFRSVVFPAPFGPTIPTVSRGLTAKSTSSSTTRAPKRFRSPAAASVGMPSAGLTSGSLGVVRLQLGLDRDALVARMLRHEEVDLELVVRLHP